MRVTLLVAAVAFAAPGTSLAQLQLGARTGVEVAAGGFGNNPQTGQGRQLSDGQVAQLPLQLEVGFDVAPEVTLGGYFGVGAGIASDKLVVDGRGNRLCGTETANGKMTCSGFDWRAGVQGRAAFAGSWQRFVPWLELGLGYESVSMRAKNDGWKATIVYTGYEVGLHAGGDFRVGRHFAFGPYAGVSVGRFRTSKVSATGAASRSFSIDEQAYHEWIGAGVRGAFSL